MKQVDSQLLLMIVMLIQMFVIVVQNLSQLLVIQGLVVEMKEGNTQLLFFQSKIHT